MLRRQLLAATSAGLAAAALPRLSFAQAEGKPLRLIVPFPPGGATDITARVLSEPLGRILGQPVIVDNRAGAGGSIGMSAIAHATPDGTTLGLATLSTHGVNPAVLKKLPYDPIHDFEPVTEVVKAPGVLVISPASIPVRTFPEFVKYLKANPGKVSYASAGNGTISHMWAELFKTTTGTSMVHIPYRGAGPALNDLLAGQVSAYFDQVASSLPYIQSGKLLALAVTWNKRLDVLPQVPTYAELGFPADNDPSWFGLVAPHGTSPAIVLKTQQAVVAALKEPDVAKRLADQGLYPSGSSPESFGKQVAAEIAKMRKVGAAANIQLD